jgi:hypothetical protein
VDKKKDDNTPFAIGMGGLVAMAIFSQRQNEIKHWLYDNMMMLVLAGFAILAFLVYRGLQKIKKREEELLKRMRAVKSVQPQRNEGDYYRRHR